MFIVHIADGWLLWDSVMINVVLFGMYVVGLLSVFDVLLLLVLMVGAWMWLVQWLGNVGLFALGVVSVVMWQL